MILLLFFFLMRNRHEAKPVDESWAQPSFSTVIYYVGCCLLVLHGRRYTTEIMSFYADDRPTCHIHLEEAGGSLGNLPSVKTRLCDRHIDIDQYIFQNCKRYYQKEQMLNIMKSSSRKCNCCTKSSPWKKAKQDYK
ncbi:unnamed protein product, partial [Amoebophrya sp. A25]|eukprot:GSA25T00011233001.1